MLRNSTKHDENDDDADDDDEDDSDNDGDDDGDDDEPWHRTIAVLTSRNISIICN
jgi:hypothetical protein